MGNPKHSSAVEPKKRKKKGRPSLLDLQKRSLRLQKQSITNPSNPTPPPNPYLRFPPSSSAAIAARRSTRRNPIHGPTPEAHEEDGDDEDDDQSSGRRREKKLRLVLRLHPNGSNSARDDSDSLASASDSDARRKRNVDSLGKTERLNLAASKAMDAPKELSHSGPTTPLPDKKLLVFILDRLQKKDTYGVFSEPVDPNELPDYHDIIEHPMDFGTIRKKLSSGAYSNLEQFEKDVFLISSNAMQYNASDTIYYRQARQIQELAKKNFENLRQESDDNEPEPRPARRGRPPTKNIFKKLGRPPADRVGSDFSSSTTLANAGDDGQWSNFSHNMSRKGLEKPNLSEIPTRPYGLRNLDTQSWNIENKSERNEDYSGSALKGALVKHGKKFSIVDENRRVTYKYPQISGTTQEAPILTALDGERKELVPVGIRTEHAYARSLARFAANLGPIGWEVAAKLIERALPPGTKFGRGWVGENDVPPQALPPLLRTSPHSSKTETIQSNARLSMAEQPSNNLIIEEVRATTGHPLPTTSSPAPKRFVNSVEGTEFAKNHESGFKPHSSGSGGSGVAHGIWPKTPFQLHQNPIMQTTLNGFNSQMMFNQPSQVGKTATASTSAETFSIDTKMTHSRALDMVSRNNNSFVHHTPMNHFSMDKVNPVADPSTSSNPCNHLRDSTNDPSQGPWRGLSLNSKQSSVPPDLNIGFQSPGSPVSGVLVDSQHPDLALQL